MERQRVDFTGNTYVNLVRSAGVNLGLNMNSLSKFLYVFIFPCISSGLNVLLILSLTIFSECICFGWFVALNQKG